MTDSPAARPVWLTREQRDKLAAFMDELEITDVELPKYIARVRSIVAAWDAAPADATEAVLAAINTSRTYQHTGSSTGPKPKFPDEYTAYLYPDRITRAVLAALGAPDG